jgi:hypothetical protein
VIRHYHARISIGVNSARRLTHDRANDRKQQQTCLTDGIVTVAYSILTYGLLVLAQRAKSPGYELLVAR